MAVITGQERIADVFGVAPKTIVEWQEQGFPIAKRGSPGVPSEYRTEDCIEWFTQRALDRAGVESAKDRLSRLQGDKVERELRVMDRELLSAADVEPAMTQFLNDLCALVDQLPDEYVDSIAAVASDPHAVHQVLKDISMRIKQTCATYEFSDGAGEEAGSQGL